MPEEGTVRATERASWGDIPEVGTAEGKPGGGRSSDGGSCAHVAVDTAEVCGIAGGWVHQGEECHSLGEGVW